MKTGSFPLGNFQKRPAARRPGQSAGPMPRDEAGLLAVEALAYVAAEPERLQRFLSLTGLSPGNLREISADPGFLSSVLEHLASDEALLVAFCQSGAHDPLSVMQAIRGLGGGAVWDST